MHPVAISYFLSALYWYSFCSSLLLVTYTKTLSVSLGKQYESFQPFHDPTLLKLI